LLTRVAATLAQREAVLSVVCHDVQRPVTVVLAQTQLLAPTRARPNTGARATRCVAGLDRRGQLPAAPSPSVSADPARARHAPLGRVPPAAPGRWSKSWNGRSGRLW